MYLAPKHLETHQWQWSRWWTVEITIRWWIGVGVTVEDERHWGTSILGNLIPEWECYLLARKALKHVWFDVGKRFLNDSWVREENFEWLLGIKDKIGSHAGEDYIEGNESMIKAHLMSKADVDKIERGCIVKEWIRHGNRPSSPLCPCWSVDTHP